MHPNEAAARAKKEVRPPWDDLRDARVHRKVVAGVALARRNGEQASRATGRVWVRAMIAAAATLVIAIAAVFVVARDGWNASGPDALVASAPLLRLPDGSIVTVADPGGGKPARVVPTLVSATRIEVDQASGQALYAIAKNPARAFVVRAGDVEVEVVGTTFRIDRLDAAVRVVVIEGHVRVRRGERAVDLVGGDDFTFGPSAPVETARQDETQPRRDEGPLDPPPPPPATASVMASSLATAEPSDAAARLFRAADDARASGDVEGALAKLRVLVTEHPNDARSSLAWFTIGRLETQRGNVAEAARAFEACGGAMNGEALAEAAIARASLGQTAAASALASRYLAAFADGPRRAQMQSLVR